MPTPSEQKALAFVAVVTLLGGAVRVLRAGPAHEPSAVEQQALSRQGAAADSAAGSKQKSTKRGRSSRSSRNDNTVHVVGGVASVPNSYARPDAPFAKSPYGYPPPSARIDVGVRAAAPPSVSTPGTANGTKTAGATIDVDAATSAEIEKLPRIGPALARRIVANRDSFGAFGSLEAMHRVKGMGPATLRQISGFVSFSGRH